MMVKYLLIAIFSLSVFVVEAEEMTISPFTRGTLAEIKNQYQGKPFILVFWSESCGYCMKELALFGRIQGQYPGIELVTVATDPFLEEETVNQVLERSQLNLKQTWVFADQFPERLYSDINKRWRGELPMTHFYDSTHNELRHMGIVEEDKLRLWLDSQAIL